MVGLSANPCDFASIEDIMRICNAPRSTARRWKAKPDTMPAAAARLLRFGIRGDLAELFGPEWEGYTMQRGKLYAPLWRNGFAPNEINAMFFRVQLVRSLEADLRLARRDLEQERARCEELERSNAFYRAQVVQASRFGLMLERIERIFG